MKVLLFTILFTTTASAYAGELACWNTYARRGARPVLTATIVNNNTLSNVKINLSDESRASYQLVESQGKIKGEEITSNRSPYKGNNAFALETDGRLVIPTDLSSENLRVSLSTGISRNATPGENAVIIGSLADGDGAGSHFSIRMRCRSK
jgi:hypothetical protein